MLNVAIIGAGYVGLVTGGCLANLGHHVTVVDLDKDKIDDLNQAIMPIHEPGLGSMIKDAINKGRLVFTTHIEDAVSDASVIIIAVGTPTNPKDGSCDLRYVFAVVEAIALHLQSGAVIVTKSTVPVGTGKKIAKQLSLFIEDKEIAVASNPEFLREGSAVTDFMHPDRIIVGVENAQAAKLLRMLYKPFMTGSIPYVETDIASAELTKYAANTFLATKISFINEMADLCEKSGANIQDVSYAMGLDPRIAPGCLQPGPGIGGSCFPKDTLALVHMANALGAKASIVDAVIASNEDRKYRMAEKVITSMDGVHGKVIAVLGLTFKANTDDMRCSASLVVVPELLQHGAKLRLYDPGGMAQAKLLFGDENIIWCDSTTDALTATDGCVIITEWQEFKSLGPDSFKAHMTTPRVVDLRNLFLPSEMETAGILYDSLGRK